MKKGPRRPRQLRFGDSQVDKAAAGDDVIVSRNGKPVVRITRLEGGKRRIKFGTLKGKIKIKADFDAPLAAEVLAAFEGQ